ncbi:MAG: protein kinase [Gemmataceae bacterium]|nr:protein kinase [Gemmataceae bacterium]
MRSGEGALQLERTAVLRRQGTADASGLIPRLLAASLILPGDWEALAPADRDALARMADGEKLLAALVERGLITPHIARKVAANKTFGLVLGNFRVLERLGAGGMATVYKAEHLEMRHLVAIKVLEMSPESDPRLETRFNAEMRAIARLRHPNIVAAMDAGKAHSANPSDPVLWYLVMEYVPGEDLDRHVRTRGALPVETACDLACQIASALAETHKLGLIHRDIKPPNVLVTPEGQAKLLDFGLSQHRSTRLTQPGTVMGTVDFMAPEQARDSSAVDCRADIYSLGGTLYWCLAGQLPFPEEGSAVELLLRRLTQQPPSLRESRPDIPAELDAVVRKMMALEPADRYASAKEVMSALLPFQRSEAPRGSDPGRSRPVPLPEAARRVQRVLLVDEQPGMRLFCKAVLQGEWVQCEEAGSGQEALVMAAERLPDLVLLDLHLKGMPGAEVLRALRANHPGTNLKVFLLADQGSADDLARLLPTGADDFVTKPFSVTQFAGRVQAALRLKAAQDRADELNGRLAEAVERLEQALAASRSESDQVRNALVSALARLPTLREDGRDDRLPRMRRYCRILAEEVAGMAAFSGQLDSGSIDLLELCAPLHDVGNVGVPADILLKPARLDAHERALMQAHTTMPGEILADLGRESAAAHGLFRMAEAVIRHHHERWDGTGYPDGLKGNDIPLPARIVAVADAYDAMRSRRPHRPALAHAVAVQVMAESSGQFDPALVQALQRCAAEFDRVFKESGSRIHGR